MRVGLVALCLVGRARWRDADKMVGAGTVI